MVIITHHERPPIPIRSCDWYAYYEGQEESGHYGWGHTEADAIEDLKLNYDPDDAWTEHEPDYDVPTAREEQFRMYEMKYYGKGL